MVAGFFAFLAFAGVGNAMATPAQRDDAKERMDRIGKPMFGLALVVVAVWIWMG